MSDVILGIKPNQNAGRDAIHVAVIPVVAQTTLNPGDRVDEKGYLSEEPVGIVDPFLDEPVQSGESFWLCLFQQTVTGMRHHWSHPSFPDNIPALFSQKYSKEESLEWLRDFASNVDINLTHLITAAVGGNLKECKDAHFTCHITDDCFYVNGTDAYGEIPSEFWDHVENYTGKKCPARAKYFRCSC